MTIIWRLVLFAPFFIPAHFYPVPTYPEELIAAILIVSLGVCGILSRKSRVNGNQLIIWWLGLGAIWMLSWVSNQKAVVSGAFFYQIFWVLGLIALVAGASLKEKVGKDKLIDISARTLVFSGFLYAALGLFGYYGGLKFVIPWLTSDQSRLVGLMGHPNLSGLYLAMSLAAFGYFLYSGRHRLLEFKSVLVLLALCLAGVLTGSRAFFVILSVQVFLSLYWMLRMQGREKREIGRLSAAIIFQCSALLLSVLLFFAFPPVDEVLSQRLTEIGVLERQSSSEMLAERFQRTEQPRLGEWRKVFQGTEVIDNIWVGVGPGSYSEFSVAADAVIEDPYRNGKTWRNAHNIFLMAFVEWGVIGVVFVFCFFVFLLFCFLGSNKNPGNYFVWLALVAIITHNLIEFSLWHLQFLVVFLILLSTQIKTVSFSLSSPSLRWVVVIPIILLSSWIGIASSRDFSKMVYLFSKPDVGEEDVKTLDLVAQNSLWRPYSRLVMYFRLNPYATGIDNQLKEATAIAEWSPMNLILMRQASLTAALGQDKLACKRIHRATELYPAIIPTLEEELVYLESQGALSSLEEMSACFSKKSSVDVRR
ncbi:Wzy polymerase domain-containing protein [Marinobacter alexandrii]|uniref:PglL family O-oligosaccharyltransferase n=1 Tax=Marinobacter alexandrii TaxID=2570351 RepID=UPI001FFEBCBE|nr:Wzy polymerase domain-containing protein [Marinobacter alexandrii]MCK2150085.1 Wzy polymerase domain-containing protein [Marinobacter alexandrii]